MGGAVSAARGPLKHASLFASRSLAPAVDEARLAEAQRDLVEWGLLDVDEKGLAWSRRFRGAVMRAAMKLADEERAGRKPPGHPVENAVALALSDLGAGNVRPEHAKLLVAVEVAALPEGVRSFWEK